MTSRISSQTQPRSNDGGLATTRNPFLSRFLRVQLLMNMTEAATAAEPPSLSPGPITSALFCQEIVEAIFSHLSLNSVISPGAQRDRLRGYLNELEQRERRHTLASAARVSKHISEAALSVLWARLDNFHRLFRVLPQYIPTSWDAHDNCFDGEPSEVDWTRFEQYAVLVREAHSFSVRSNEKKVWEIILNRYRTASRFLPRLTALATLHVTGPADTLFDLPLLLPTLRHLSIQLNPSRPRIPSDSGALITTALERIAMAIPSLSSLTISFACHEPTQISWKMASFQSLRKLNMTDDLLIGTLVLAAIGRFHDLRTLSISISDDCSHIQGCLQALVALNIRGRPSHIQSFLTATSPPLLQSLSLFFVHDPSTDPLMRCMSAVSVSLPTTLSALALESDLSFNPPITSILDVVEPALALRALTDFTFKFRPLPLSVSDSDILAILAAWPSLATLRIPHAYAGTRPPQRESPQPARPTALLFLSIASRFPLLDTLELPEVDLSAAPGALAALPLPAALGPRAGHPLRVLDMASGSKLVSDSDSDSDSGWRCADRRACMCAAAMLDRLFPRMELPRLGGDAYARDNLKETGWEAVVRLLHAMQAGRAHADAFEREGCSGEGAGAGEDGRGEREGSDSDGGPDSD